MKPGHTQAFYVGSHNLALRIAADTLCAKELRVVINKRDSLPNFNAISSFIIQTININRLDHSSPIFQLNNYQHFNYLTFKMSDKVDVSGIDKVQLLRGLWAKSPVSFWCRANGVYQDFDAEAAKKQFVELGGYYDYFCGRVIKCNLKGDTVDPWGYDRDNGDGAFQEVVTEIRERYNIPPVKASVDEAATDASSK
jgi:hypothetical protein